MLVVMASLIQVWRTQRAYDRMAQDALAQQPIVNGHLGELHSVERIATSRENPSGSDAISYRLHGNAGTGVVTAHFTTVDAAHLRISEGVLRTDDNIVYPIKEPDSSGTADASVVDNDPLRPRLEYMRSRDHEKDFPRIFVDIISSNHSDLELIQYARRWLIGPLAHIQNVERVYSMGSQDGQAIVQLQLDHARMATLKLSTQDVREALLSNHFQQLPAAAGKEIYTWSSPDHDAHSPREILSTLPIQPANAPAVQLGQISRIVLSIDPPRQALGLVISDETHADPESVVAEARKALANQTSPDIQLDAHPVSQVRVRLMP